MKLEPGLYANVPESEYRAWDAVNASTLNTLKRSPAHARYEMEHPREPSEEMALGSMIHTALLQPAVFDEEYVVMPDFATGLCDEKGKPYSNPRASNKYKSLVTQWLEDRGDKKVIEAAQLETCVNVASAIRNHPSASLFIQHSTAFEVSASWIDEPTGLLCKGRLDAICEPFDAIVDLKTTRDASYQNFTKSIFNFGYHRQGAMYVAGAQALGIEVKHYVIIAVEKEPPYGVAVYRLDDEALAFGRKELDELLVLYKQCKESGDWPGYDSEVSDIGLPEWAKKQR
jgi:hypothetical protein